MTRLLERFLLDIDLCKNQILNFKIQPVTSRERIAIGNSLSVTEHGLTVYDKEENSLYTWDGTMWIVSTTASININKKSPATSTSTGIPGETRTDDEYFYICVSENTWRRIPFDNW